MSVLDRSALEASPLSDLHAIASELEMDGFRRLRKADLVDAILQRGGGEQSVGDEPSQAGGQETRADADAPPESDAGAAAAELDADDVAPRELDDDAGVREPDADAAARAEEGRSSRPRGRRRGGRGRGRARDGDAGSSESPREREREAELEPERSVEGVVELLGNGSGFVRVSPPDPSDEDVYISAAQVRRCELVSGDRIAGPVRKPRRSERFPSLVRVDTINGRPADEVAEGTRYEELPAAFPAERYALASEDPTLKAIEWLTPFGRGSRVALVGPARAGKSEALRRLAAALAAVEGVEPFLVLAGTRPEEVGDWSAGAVAITATAGLEASSELQDHAVETAVDQGRRIAARGSDAVVLIDSLDGVSARVARRAMAAARNIVDGGSLTVLAVNSRPLGGETTVIAFDAGLAAAGRFPAIDVGASGTMRPELLVGEAGAEAIARARAETFAG